MSNKIISHFQKAEQLSVKNLDYQRILEELFLFFVRNDRVEDDVTVQMFLPDVVSQALKTGVISAKTSCVVAGVAEVEFLAGKHTKLTPKQMVQDGESVTSGTKIISFTGAANEILAYERVFINILQRMSGIATETHQYVEKVRELGLANPPLIAATRKTPWMHVDKKAVAVGGGVTHRLNLSDGILLKDNHLELLQQSRLTRSLRSGLAGEAEAISYVISNANILDETIAVEVEVKTEEGALAAVESFQKRKLKNPFIILLDNFTPERAKKIIQKICHSERSEKSTDPSAKPQDDSRIFFEASGGITLDNVSDFAKTGVDVISIGALTHSPKAADLSLDIY